MLIKLKESFVAGMLIVFFSTTLSFALTSIANPENTDKDQRRQGLIAPREAAGGAKFRVINIVLAKIDDEFIYAQDGRQFRRSPRTRIIRNPGSSMMRIARLTFHGDILIRVVIK